LKQKYLNSCMAFSRAILFILITMLTLSCGSRSVKIIEKEVDFVVEKSFSSEEIESPYFFGAIFNICTNSKYIYVADWKNYCIKIFDKAFNFVKKVGERGKGPKQFGQIFTDMTCDDEHIYLLTITRLYIFSTQGDYQKEIPLRVEANSVFPVKEGFLLKKNFSDTAFKLIDTDGKDIKTFFQNKSINAKECGKIYAFPQAFLSSQGFFFIMDSTGYNIRLLDIATGKATDLIARDCDFLGLTCRADMKGNMNFSGGNSQMLESQDKLYYIYYKSEKEMKIDFFKKPKSLSHDGLTVYFTGTYTGKFVPSCLDRQSGRFIGNFRDDEETVVVCRLEEKL
jgi:hypothetical protein